MSPLAVQTASYAAAARRKIRGIPQGRFDFDGSLPTGAAYTRANQQFVYDSARQFTAVAANTAPFNYDKSTGVLLGLFMRDRTYTNKVTAGNINPTSVTASDWLAGNAPELAPASGLWAANYSIVQNTQIYRSPASGLNVVPDDDSGNTNIHVAGGLVLAQGTGGSPDIGFTGSPNPTSTYAIGSPTFASARGSLDNNQRKLSIRPNGNVVQFFGQFMIETNDVGLDEFDIPIGSAATVSPGSLVLTVENGTYVSGQVVLTTEDGPFINSQTIVVSSLEYTFDWADFSSATGDHIRTIDFGGQITPPPPPSVLRFPLGFGLLGNSDGGEFPQNQKDNMDADMRCIMQRLTHIDIEPNEGDYRFDDADAAVQLASEKASETGQDYHVVLLFQMRPFGGNQDSPFTSAPGWIIDDPGRFDGIVKTFQGQTRQWGGLWERRNNVNRWVTGRFHPAYHEVSKELCRAYIQRYRSEPLVRGLNFPESALGIEDLNNIQSYQDNGAGEGYFDNTLQWMKEIIQEEDPPFPIFHGSTFWHGAKGGDRPAAAAFVEAADKFNASRGKEQLGVWWPDSRSGDRSNLPWYLGYEDAHADGFSCPMVASLQTSSYNEINSGDYTYDQVLNDMHNRFELLTAWVGGQNNNFNTLKNEVATSTNARVVAWRDRVVWYGSDINIPNPQ